MQLNSNSSTETPPLLASSSALDAIFDVLNRCSPTHTIDYVMLLEWRMHARA